MKNIKMILVWALGLLDGPFSINSNQVIQLENWFIPSAMKKRRVISMKKRGFV